MNNVVGGHPSTAIFNVLQPVTDAQTCEVGTTLATLTLGSLSDVGKSGTLVQVIIPYNAE
jgi:hypothetical protein